LFSERPYSNDIPADKTRGGAESLLDCDAPKRLLLFKAMAEEANVGDQGLFHEIISDFSLTGEMPESRQFPIKFKPAVISVQQLRESAGWAKKMIVPSCRRVGMDAEIALAVYSFLMVG
jgi:hypothetical protein